MLVKFKCTQIQSLRSPAYPSPTWSLADGVESQLLCCSPDRGEVVKEGGVLGLGPEWDALVSSVSLPSSWLHSANYLMIVKLWKIIHKIKLIIVTIQYYSGTLNYIHRVVQSSLSVFRTFYHSKQKLCLCFSTSCPYEFAYRYLEFYQEMQNPFSPSSKYHYDCIPSPAKLWKTVTPLQNLANVSNSQKGGVQGPESFSSMNK